MWVPLAVFPAISEAGSGAFACTPDAASPNAATGTFFTEDCNLGLLTKFTPGQSISLTGRVRDDRQDNGRLDIPSEFPSNPEPQKIRHRQPSRLLGVNPPTKDHKDAIVSRGTATERVAIPCDRTRNRDQHSALTGRRANYWVFVKSPLQWSNTEVLPDEEFRHPCVNTRLGWGVRIAYPRSYFPNKREWQQEDDEPLKPAGKAHVVHLTH